MDYSVKVFASQASGFSDALTGAVKTRKADVPSPRRPHVLLPLCFHCNSSPAFAWLGGWLSFSQHCLFWMVFHGKKSVLLTQGWSLESWLAGERQSLAFKYMWWRIGFPSGKFLLAFFKLGENFQPACRLTQPTPVTFGPWGSLPFLKASACCPWNMRAHTHMHTHMPSVEDKCTTLRTSSLPVKGFHAVYAPSGLLIGIYPSQTPMAQCCFFQTPAWMFHIPDICYISTPSV